MRGLVFLSNWGFVLAKRIRIALQRMSSSKVGFGPHIISFTKSGKDWISEPVSDAVAAIVEEHPHYQIFDDGGEFETVELSVWDVDFSSVIEVETLLRSMSHDDLTDMAGSSIFTGMADPILRSFDPDTLRQIVRENCDVSTLLGYVSDPVPILRNHIVANSARIAANRDNVSKGQFGPKADIEPPKKKRGAPTKEERRLRELEREQVGDAIDGVMRSVTLDSDDALPAPIGTPVQVAESDLPLPTDPLDLAALAVANAAARAKANQ